MQVIKSISLLQTANMIEKGMDPRYQIGVVGDYPRTDKPGRQCTVSVPEKTIAIALQSTGRISAAMSLDQAVAFLRSDVDWIEDFIGGKIFGVEFQAKGAPYTLTEQSREVRNGEAQAGDKRQAKEATFVIDYNSFMLTRSEESRVIDKLAKHKLAAENFQSDMFANIFGGGETTEEPETTEEGDSKVWNDTLESMVTYAEELGIRDDLNDVLTKGGALRTGKTLEELETVIKSLAE